MGSDIHLHTEKKVDGKWVAADEWFETDGKLSPWDLKVEPHKEPFYHDRNYDLFSILADIRNGYGFAGRDTGDGFNPIAPPKGLPADVSPEVEAYSEDWGINGHSHSHFTVKELIGFDWTQTTEKRGYASVKDFFRYKITGNPHGHSSFVGGDIEMLSNDEMINHIKEKYEVSEFNWSNFDAVSGLLLGRIYTPISWEVSYYEVANHFISDAMPRLWALGSPEDVRIVFWFDN